MPEADNQSSELLLPREGVLQVRKVEVIVRSKPYDYIEPSIRIEIEYNGKILVGSSVGTYSEAPEIIEQLGLSREVYSGVMIFDQTITGVMEKELKTMMRVPNPTTFTLIDEKFGFAYNVFGVNFKTQNFCFSSSISDPNEKGKIISKDGYGTSYETRGGASGELMIHGISDIEGIHINFVAEDINDLRRANISEIDL